MPSPVWSYKGHFKFSTLLPACFRPPTAVWGFFAVELNIKTLLLDSAKKKKLLFWMLPNCGTPTLAQNILITTVKDSLEYVKQQSGGTLRNYHCRALMSALSADSYSVSDILMISFSVLFRFQLSSGVKSGNNHIHFLKVEVGWTICVYNMTSNIKNINISAKIWFFLGQRAWMMGPQHLQHQCLLIDTLKYFIKIGWK